MSKYFKLKKSIIIYIEIQKLFTHLTENSCLTTSNICSILLNYNVLITATHKYEAITPLERIWRKVWRLGWEHSDADAHAPHVGDGWNR